MATDARCPDIQNIVLLSEERRYLELRVIFVTAAEYIIEILVESP